MPACAFRPGAHMVFRWLFLLPLSALCLVPPDAAKDKTGGAAATDADKAAARVQVEKGLKVEVWAAEPLFKNPVAFAFDEKGKCFVVEANRLNEGVPDTRSFMQWLDDDLAATTVADRVAMYKKHKYQGFEKAADQVTVVWDAAGTGRADRSEVFSGGYNRPEDGLAAGVLARKGSVYLTGIPDLYRLKDTTGANKADVKESLATGFGVHVQFVGHDLHGLRMGPDGKLYFSIGDRGFTVTTKEGKTLSNPDSGAVLRCDPDGANLEVVHVGLRNPQELAFDDFGNLFTYDNNSDSGDQARWVQIVEGGDSGWRCGYQYGTLMHPPGVPQGNRGPWNAERIWQVPGKDGGPPAYVVPPLANFGNGPAGLTHYPGVGLGERYRDHFFACDFTSGAGSSVVWSLAVKPKGASFEVTDRHAFVRNAVPTDCEFGPDSAFYWTDWISGWGKPNKGRVFRLTDPEAMKNPAVAEAKALLAAGFEKRSVNELAKLLGHPHSQVRFEAQYELVTRKRDEAIPAFANVARTSKVQLARIHAIWGLGQFHASAWLEGYADDPDVEIRAQVAKTHACVVPMPEVKERAVREALKLMRDPEPRVQAFAALAVGRVFPLPNRQIKQLAFDPVSAGEAHTALLNVLAANNDRDTYLRQAAADALSRIPDVPVTLSPKLNTPAVRLGVVLALRKHRSPKLAEFLADGDPVVATEAARAVYDERVEAALPKLAELADASKLSDPIAYRALAANFFLGKPGNATRLAAFAGRSVEPDHLRVAAVKLLADWAKPPRRDPITGLRLALPDRPPADVVAAVAPIFPKLFGGSDALRKEAVGLAAKIGLADVGPQMAALVANGREPVEVRAEALFALEALKAKQLPDALAAAKSAAEPKLRAAAVVVAARANPQAAGVELQAVLTRDGASVVEKQAALSALGGLKELKDADTALAAWLDKLAANDVPAELKLDVFEAAQARATAKNLKLHADLREKLKALDGAARAAEAKDPLARSREVLAGGDADKGRWAFLNNSAVYCQRCHKLDGQGGEVGPPLNGVGKQHPREYLLESILHPSKDIAKGFESVILSLADGRTVSGVLRSKDAKGYVVVQGDGKVVTVPKDDVDAEKPDKSAMPDDLHKKLSKRELRDLVEFLASLTAEPAK